MNPATLRLNNKAAAQKEQRLAQKKAAAELIGKQRQLLLDYAEKQKVSEVFL